MLRRAVCGAAFLVAIPVIAAAATTLNSDSRGLQVNGTDLGCGFSDTFISPSAPFAPFVVSNNVALQGPYEGFTVGAAQSTTVSTTHLGGTGSATNNASGHFCGVSRFEITFSIDSSTPYVLDGALTTSSAGNANAFFGSSSGTILSEFRFTPGSTPLSRSGVLAPGTYQLSVVANARPGDASWSFGLTLVPEPATASFLALGIGALSAARRLRRRSAT